jgi:hypothetical protein
VKRFPEKAMQSQSKTNSEVEQDRAMLRKVFLLVSAIVMVGSVMAACGQPAQSPPKPAAPQPPTTQEQPPEQTTSVDDTTNEAEWNMVQTFNGKGSQTTPPFHISGIEWRIMWSIDTENLKYAVFELFVYPKDKPDMLTKRTSYSGDRSSDTMYIYQGGRDYYLKIISANLGNWTITVQDKAAAKALISPIQITRINYKGRGYMESLEGNYDIIEADEYVEIKNLSDSKQNISGWVLKNLTKGGPAFVFPTSMPCSCEWYGNWEDCIKNCYPPRPCAIDPHKSLRVYTGEVHYESGGFCFYYFPGDIWNNKIPDIAVLYNRKGQEVSRKSYVIPTKNSIISGD